jgi:outer membrane autotransporter protein
MGGVRLASVNGGAFTESGAGAASGFGVSGASTTQLSVVPYARIVVSRDFALASGVTLSPYAALGYQYQAGTTEQPVLLTASDGTMFNAGSASLDRSAATLGVGVAAGQGNWSVFAAYGALVSGNWQEQEVNVGVRVDF